MSVLFLVLNTEPAACVAKACAINKCSSKAFEQGTPSVPQRSVEWLFTAALLNPSIHADITLLLLHNVRGEQTEITGRGEDGGGE